jgi:hypothetical protein
MINGIFSRNEDLSHVKIYSMPKNTRKSQTIVECKTTNKNGKRILVYVNNRTKKILPIVVGKLGGISVKTPGKNRRYVKSICTKRASANSLFWITVNQRRRTNKEKRKKTVKRKHTKSKTVKQMNK